MLEGVSWQVGECSFLVADESELMVIMAKGETAILENSSGRVLEDDRRPAVHGPAAVTYARRIRRYAAYYRGWCQAFGEHEAGPVADDSENAGQWLFGVDRVGLILPEETRKRLLKELVRAKGREPSISFSQASSEISVNGLVCAALSGNMVPGVERLVALAKQHNDVHMFLTHHLCYPGGTRIITFSAPKPLVILYKEIDPLVLRVL